MGRNIGKMVPTSKRMIKWGFIINMKKVEVVLKHSTVSGKRLIRVNEVVIHESRGVRAIFLDWLVVVEDIVLNFFYCG